MSHRGGGSEKCHVLFERPLKLVKTSKPTFDDVILSRVYPTKRYYLSNKYIYFFYLAWSFIVNGLCICYKHSSLTKKIMKIISFEFLTRLTLFLDLSLFYILDPRSARGSTFGIIMITWLQLPNRTTSMFR